MISSRGPTPDDRRSRRLENIQLLLQATRTILLFISIFWGH